jgi:hypothetical protein
MACSDGDPLRSMPPTTMLESSPSGNKHKLSRWSVMNSRPLKRMAGSWVSSTLKKEMPPAAVGLCRWNHQNVWRNSALQIPVPSALTVGVFYTGKNRVVKIARSSSEMVLLTTKHTMISPGSGPSLEVIALSLAV